MASSRIAALFVIGLAADSAWADTLPAAASVRIDFATHIAPILREQCVGCHAGLKAKAGLRLDTREHTLQGGYSGAILQPGKSADSRLVQVVAGVAEDMVVMPPKGRRRLTSAEVALLRAWIDQGAAWPKELVLVPRNAEDPAGSHWAFRALQRPGVPTVKNTGSARNAIDRFILSRLEAEDIAPSPEASPVNLIRRVSLDLTGLPPTVAEIDAFLQDRQPGAYERLVDRLFTSPHYGEKWARPWLDLAHYGDTDGYLTDQRRPVQWRYRHWLIDAINRDLPFDQFTLQQLAGDLLPGANLDQVLATGFLRNTLANREGGADLEEYRVEQVVDRVTMLGTAWLGLTVGCARCHDHKYDPVSQKDFYRLYACFDNADEVNIDAPLPGELTAYLAKRPTFERKRAELLQPLSKQIDELQARWEKKLLHAADHPGENAVWDRQWEVLGLVWGGDMGEGQLEGCYIVRTAPDRRSQDQKDRLLDYFLTNGAVIDDARFKELKLAELSKKLTTLQNQYPRPTRAPTMRQTDFPRKTHLHVRGNFRSPGIVVGPGVPAWLSASGGKETDRLGLAQWLVSPENPLTARVTVNRFWQEFFGRGLVFTSEDFGVRGEKPSHPELLDWLAVEFREGGWSRKALHRLIVTSATYRQSARARPELETRDPRNTLLARQTSVRLSAEQIRDALLLVSGLMQPRIGGPSVFPPQPDSVSAEAEIRHKWVTSKGADRYRRGLYTWAQRLTPFAQNVTFDAPPLSRSCTRRERSTTPLQALLLLNDPLSLQAAQALAARVLPERPGSIDERIEYAFRTCVARLPRQAERERLAAYYREQLAILRGEPKEAARLYPHAQPGTDPAEGAAWACVCSVLLNLHEFIMRD